MDHQNIYSIVFPCYLLFIYRDEINLIILFLIKELPMFILLIKELIRSSVGIKN